MKRILVVITVALATCVFSCKPSKSTTTNSSPSGTSTTTDTSGHMNSTDTTHHR